MSARSQPEQRQRQPGREHETRPQPDYEPKYPGVGKLKGRVALITGGDSGIGRATAIAMAREGANIAIVYLEEDRDADETLRLVEREGTRGIKVAGDVGDEAFCAQAVERGLGVRLSRHSGQQRGGAARDQGSDGDRPR
jgi:hypothetical protein